MSYTRPARYRWFDHALIVDAANKVVIDESGANEAYDFAITAASAGESFDVGAHGTTSGHTDYYSDVDDLSIVGSINNDTFEIDARPLTAGALLTIDGGGGLDNASIDWSANKAVLHRVDDQTVSGSNATFTGIATYVLNLGVFDNDVATLSGNDIVNLTTGSREFSNRVQTGSGDDIVRYIYPFQEEPKKGSGHDHMDLGEGIDYWAADYGYQAAPSTVNIVNGNVLFNNDISIDNVERIQLRLGQGDDVVNFVPATLYGPDSIRINGYYGSDILNADCSNLIESSIFSFYDYIDSSVFSISNSTGSSSFTFNAINVIGTKLDDIFTGEYYGYSIAKSLDGGQGFDTLRMTDGGRINLIVHDDGTIDCDQFLVFFIEKFDIEGFGTISTGSADDVISGGGSLFGRGGNDKITGTYTNDDILGGGDGDDILDGGAGSDTASYWDAGSAVKVALIAGAQDTGGAGIDTLSNIENLTGSDFNDRLTGNSAANVLEGGRGNDVLDGGGGLDTASYAGALSAVRVDLAIAGAQKTAGAGQDTLVSIENLTGSAFDDVLAGNAGDNVLAGGLGYDLLSYAGATQGVTVDLRVVGAQDTGYGRDTLSGFEAIVGSVYNDTLNGDFQDNILEGGAGDDTLDGTTGLDTASYAHAAAGVTVSLALTTAQDTGGAGLDTLRNIEALAGSAFADVLNGGALGDRLAGSDGDDRLTGAGGADTLDGGVGVDTAVYTGGPWAQYDVVATADGYEITRVGAPDNHDTLTAVERVSFDEQTFDIADTVNVGPNGRGDHGGDLREAADGDKGVSSARGNVLANDRDANLATPELGEALHVSAAGVVPSTFLQVTDEVTIQGRYGTLLIEADGSYRYKLDNRLPATDHLDAGDVGRERFFYEVSDVHGATSLARVIFLIAGADDAGHPASPAATPFDPVSHDWPLSADGQMYV